MTEPLTATIATEGVKAAAAALTGPLKDLYSVAKAEFRAKIGRWKAEKEVRALAERLEQVEFVRTVSCSTPRRLTSFYYPSQVTFGRGSRSSRIIHSIDDIDPTQNVLLTGTVGQGKSMLMRYLCIREASRGKVIPIFCELRGLDEKTNLQGLLCRQLSLLGFSGVDQGLFQYLLDQGTFLFFLDGFDEIKREFALPAQLELIRFVNSSPKTRWAISARAGTLSQYASAIPNLAFAEIAPLQAADFDPFLKVLGVSDEQRKILLKAIEGSSTQIKGVLKTPLMLTLLQMTFGTSKDIPDTLHEFYECMFNFLLTRHDETKIDFIRQKATQLSNADLQDAFEHFCYLSKQQYGIALNDADFADCAKNASRVSGKSFTPDGFKTDLTETVCLMVRDGLKTAFIHRSVQEFFAASFIKHLGKEETVKRIYENLRSSRYLSWRQEIKFLEQTDRFRFLEYYWIPNAEEFLKLCGYSRKSDVHISKANFEKTLSQQPIRILRLRESKAKYRPLLVGAPTAFGCPAILPTVLNALSDQWVIITPDEEESFSLHRSFKSIPIKRHLSENPDELMTYLAKFRNYAAKLDRDLQRNVKALTEREKSLSELLK